MKSLRLSKSLNKKNLIVNVAGSWHGSVDQFLFNIKNIISINNSEWVLKKKTKTVSATIRDVACPFCGLLCDDLIIENKIDHALDLSLVALAMIKNKVKLV